MRLKTALLTLSLSCLSFLRCASLPPLPHHVQYGIYPQVNPPGFYGTDNEDKSHHYEPFTSQTMRGGQCLTSEDYKAWTEWISAVKLIAEQHCR